LDEVGLKKRAWETHEIGPTDTRKGKEKTTEGSSVFERNGGGLVWGGGVQTREKPKKENGKGGEEVGVTGGCVEKTNKNTRKKERRPNETINERMKRQGEKKIMGWKTETRETQNE